MPVPNIKQNNMEDLLLFVQWIAGQGTEQIVLLLDMMKRWRKVMVLIVTSEVVLGNPLEQKEVVQEIWESLYWPPGNNN